MAKEAGKGTQQAVGAVSFIMVPKVEIDPAMMKQQGTRAGKELGDGIGDAAKNTKPGEKIANEVEKEVSKDKGMSFGKKLAVGIGSGIATLKVGQLLSKGLSSASDNYNVGSKLRATMGLSPADAKKAGKIAGDIYANNYGDSLDEVAESVNATSIAMGGFNKASKAQLQETSKWALNLSNNFGVDVADSVALASELVQNKMAPDFTSATDQITKGLQKVPPAFRQDLFDGISEYTPYLHDLGYSAKEMFNILITGSKQGAIGMDKSLDVIKEMGIRSTDMSKSTIGAYQSLGLNAEEMAGKFIKGGKYSREALGMIADRLAKIPDKVTRSNTAIAIFGTQLEDLGTNGTGIDDFVKSLQTGTDVLGTTTGATKQLDAAASDLSNSSLETLSRQFNKTLGEIALPLLTALLPVFQGISSFFVENQEAISQWGGPILVIGGILAGLVFTISTVGTAIEALGVIMAVFGVESTIALGPLGLALAAIAAVIAVIAGSIAFFNANPQAADWFVNGGTPNGGAPQMANGGLVPARSGGTGVVIGEAGQAEIVMNEGLYNQQQASQLAVNSMLIRRLQTTDGAIGTVNQTNHIDATNMDPVQLDTVLTNRRKLVGSRN